MNTHQHQDPADPFGPVIYSYTRADALADGQQVDVTRTAREAGIRFPVFLTRAVFDAYVTVPPGVSGQDEDGRLWDILWMVRFAIVRAKARRQADGPRIRALLYVRNTNGPAQLVTLAAECGPCDLDDPAPAITVMLPDED